MSAGASRERSRAVFHASGCPSLPSADEVSRSSRPLGEVGSSRLRGSLQVNAMRSSEMRRSPQDKAVGGVLSIACQSTSITQRRPSLDLSSRLPSKMSEVKGGIRTFAGASGEYGSVGRCIRRRSFEVDAATQDMRQIFHPCRYARGRLRSRRSSPGEWRLHEDTFIRWKSRASRFSRLHEACTAYTAAKSNFIEGNSGPAR